MKPRGLALGLLLAAAACSHTKQVRESERKPEEAPGEARHGRAGAGLPARPGRPRVPAAPEGLLPRAEVARLQRALAGRGLLKAHRAGELDPPTTAAIERLQRKEGLAATGFPDRETLKVLGIDPEHAYVRQEDRERAEGAAGRPDRERRGEGEDRGTGAGEGGTGAGEARGAGAGREDGADPGAGERRGPGSR